MEQYIKLVFENLRPDIRDILIARLGMIGFEGFEEGSDFLLAFIPEKDFDETAAREIATACGTPFSRERLAPVNWNEEWEKSFQPVIIDDFCGIRASFHAPLRGVLHEILITPKMSFGTGHHATTALMIEAMRDTDFKDKTVLDFGTGTGVLAILAEKLEARDVLAIDYDDWSIDNARENIAGNQCTRIRLRQSDRLEAGYGRFDVLLANINRQVILANMAAMEQQLAPAGVLIVSGLLRDDFEVMAKEAAASKLQVIKQTEKNGWICLTLTRG